MKIKLIFFIVIGLILIFLILSKIFKKKDPEYNKEKEKENEQSKDTNMTNPDKIHEGKLAILNYKMNLQGDVNGKQFKTNKLQLFIIDDFLNDSECQKLIDIININPQPSKTTTGNSKYRTSYTSNLMCNDKDTNEFVEYIDYKISQKLSIPVEYSERIQGQVYDVGQEFKEHTDWFNPNLKEYKENCMVQGNRTWTFMIYLNDVEEGGETYFKAIDLKIKPKKGLAVIWNNLYQNGKVNPYTIHSGLPVKKGNKYIITKWFRKYSK